MSDEEASSSTKKKKIENTDGGNPKKVKIQVSYKETFEIDVDRLTYKPDKLLGRFFKSKKNGNGVYEIEGIDPSIFRDVLNYYNLYERVTKHNYVAGLKKACEYLDIDISDDNFDDPLYKWIKDDTKIRRGIHHLYRSHIQPYIESGNPEKKDLRLILIDSIYEDQNEIIKKSMKMQHDGIVYLDKNAYEAIDHDDYFGEFLKEKGIEDICTGLGLEKNMVGSFNYHNRRNGLPYNLLTIHYYSESSEEELQNV